MRVVYDKLLCKLRKQDDGTETDVLYDPILGEVRSKDIGTSPAYNKVLGKLIQGSLLNTFLPPDNAVVTTTNGDYIVSIDGKYILTVDGFIPLNAMRTLQGNPVVTKNNEYITI